MSRIRLRRIADQSVLVFGASSGIGRLAAIEFARRGARVMAAARGEAGLRSLADEIAQAGGHCEWLVADAADFAQVQAVADAAVRHFGRLDTWVHVAGVYMVAPFEQTGPEEFRRVVEVNLLGQIWGAKAALPALRAAGGGTLIHISSAEAVRAAPLHAAYAASKHGIPGFLDALRLELQHEGAPISVTNIMPGGINTPLFDQALTRTGVKPFPPPPIYAPQAAVDAILFAAAHPVRELVVGGAGKFLISGQRFAPRAMDWLLRRSSAFRIQRTQEPKPPEAPSNLWQPIESVQSVEGPFRRWTFPHSAYTWLATHPAVKRTLLAAAGLGIAARMLARRPRPGGLTAGRR